MSFFQKKERKDIPIPLKVTKSEDEWLLLEAERECNTKVGILRKSLKFYMSYMESLKK